MNIEYRTCKHRTLNKFMGEVSQKFFHSGFRSKLFTLRTPLVSEMESIIILLLILLQRQVQVLAVLKVLDDEAFCRDRLGREGAVGAVDRDRLNAWGGSASLGHPFGATGARLITNCCHRHDAEEARYGLVAACAAGAIGIGLVFENCNGRGG